MHNARPKVARICACRCSRTRSSSEESGGGSVTTPTDPICLNVFHIGALEIVPAVRKIERLVDQRKVRNDVADDCVLERRPVLPRRIVRMAAADAAVLSGRERYEHGAAPAFDRADGRRPRGGYRSAGPQIAGRKLRRDRRYEANRFEKLVEANGDARSDVPFGTHALLYR